MGHSIGLKPLCWNSEPFLLISLQGLWGTCPRPRPRHRGISSCRGACFMQPLGETVWTCTIKLLPVEKNSPLMFIVSTTEKMYVSSWLKAGFRMISEATKHCTGSWPLVDSRGASARPRGSQSPSPLQSSSELLRAPLVLVAAGSCKGASHTRAWSCKVATCTAGEAFLAGIPCLEPFLFPRTEHSSAQDAYCGHLSFEAPSDRVTEGARKILH